MARLPSERFLIQQIGGKVVLFEEYTQREIVSFDANDVIDMARAQVAIMQNDELIPEDKAYAHVWSGYFYAYTRKGSPVEHLRELSCAYIRDKVLRELGNELDELPDDEGDAYPERDDNDMENPYPRDHEDGEGIQIPGGYGS